MPCLIDFIRWSDGVSCLRTQVDEFFVFLHHTQSKLPRPPIVPSQSRRERKDHPFLIQRKRFYFIPQRLVHWRMIEAESSGSVTQNRTLALIDENGHHSPMKWLHPITFHSLLCYFCRIPIVTGSEGKHHNKNCLPHPWPLILWLYYDSHELSTRRYQYP